MDSLFALGFLATATLTACVVLMQARHIGAATVGAVVAAGIAYVALTHLPQVDPSPAEVLQHVSP